MSAEILSIEVEELKEKIKWLEEKCELLKQQAMLAEIAYSNVQLQHDEVLKDYIRQNQVIRAAFEEEEYGDPACSCVESSGEAL